MKKAQCLICGKPLRYFKNQEEQVCSICGKTFLSNASCEDGHFVCDSCHRQDGVDRIRRICRNTESENPIFIIRAIMEEPSIYMHGPEHHIMVAASLLAAYKNCGGKTNFSSDLEEIIRRGSMVAGGFCGFWGCCGAAVSCGIFLSVITETTPLSVEEQATAQKGTAAALEQIAAWGSPRCCKRNSFTAILTMIRYVKENLGISMEEEHPVCGFFPYNAECIGARCPFHPQTARGRGPQEVRGEGPKKVCDQGPQEGK